MLGAAKLVHEADGIGVQIRVAVFQIEIVSYNFGAMADVDRPASDGLTGWVPAVLVKNMTSGWKLIEPSL